METPTIFVTYEQLILAPEPALTDIFCFLYDVKSIEGTLLEKQVKKVCGADLTKKTVYKLKPGTGKLNR